MSFLRSWIEAVSSFVESEGPKFSYDAMEKIRKAPPSDEFLRSLVMESIGVDDISDLSLIYTLFITNNIPILKYLNDIKRINVDNEFYTKIYDSQFSGYRYIELFRVVFCLYFSVNVMTQMGIKEINPNILIQNRYFDNLRSLMKHFDQSFPSHYSEFAIPAHLCPYLKRDVLLVDRAKTRQLLKGLFRLIVNYYAVHRFIYEKDLECFKCKVLVDIFGMIIYLTGWPIEEDELLVRIANDLGIKMK